MGQRFNGNIIYVRRNFGFLSSTINGFKVRLYFVVKPEMISADNKFAFGNQVTFLTRNLSIRGTNVVVAYDLKRNKNSINNIEIEQAVPIEETNSNSFITLFRNKINIDAKMNSTLLEHEKEVQLCFLKWILYIEKETKLIIKHFLSKTNITNQLFLNTLKSNKSTKKIIEEALRKLKENTMFRYESDSLTYIAKPNDPNDIEVSDAPILMVLEQLTISDLSLVIDTCYQICSDLLSKDDQILLCYLKELFPDLMFLRNKIAHGHSLIPLIIDDTFSPSYFYEMASVFPSWNSNQETNDVEKYVAFNFIRFQARSLAKAGINLAGINGGPMDIGLFFTKSLLINQAKKSFFSFVFLIMVIFAYWNDQEYDSFFSDISSLGILALTDSPKTPFSSFPSAENSIELMLTRIIAPIFEYAGTPSSFKMFSSITIDKSLLCVKNKN